MKRLFTYFSKFEWGILLGSYLLIALSFFLFDRENALGILAPILGVSAIMLGAKGNFIGQILMIIFSIFYAIVSFREAYYGEVITYACMTLPMSVYAIVCWLRNPFRGQKTQVKVGRVTRREAGFLFLLTAAVTLIFYFILGAMGTADLFVSTVSVSTSFAAVYLTARRSPFFAIAYAANDLVLIILWIIASLRDASSLSIVACFAAFLLNDGYEFFSWRHMERRQKAENEAQQQ